MMSKPLLLLAPLLLSLVLLHHFAESNTMVIKTMMENSRPSPEPSQQPKIDCDGACDGRCQLSGRPKLCRRACGTCCHRCNCVPSGTSGHFEQCPCYANMTTHHGKRKCP